MKKGIVLEGGAMRGLFTAGVLDALMKSRITPDGIVGVSAGAAFGCNCKSRQPGRVIRYNKQFANNSKYCGLHSLLTTGNLYNAEFAYHRVPEEFDLFDNRTFQNNPMEYYVVCTDIETGLPVYNLCAEGGHTFYEWVRASSSMPIVSRPVEINGQKLLDGGLTDSIPLQFMQQQGYSKNIVILTRPCGYRKKPNKFTPLMRLLYRRYPELINAISKRHLMYNAQLDKIAECEKEGNCFVIRPDKPIEIGYTSHSPQKMQAVYQTGLETAEKIMPQLVKWWENNTASTHTTK